jgi:hypothetical protein
VTGWCRGVALAVCVAAVLCASAVIASAKLVSSGDLSLPAPNSGVDTQPYATDTLFAAAGISGGVVVAGAPEAIVGSNQAQGAVSVFLESASGWSSETPAAELVESDGQAGDQFGDDVTISGDTVVVGRDAARGVALYVFNEPAGGWSGMIQQSAELHLPAFDSCGLGMVGIPGGAIVVSSGGSEDCLPVIDVFTEPAGGWAGVTAPEPSAQLAVPSSDSQCFGRPHEVSTGARAIVAACSDAAYVYTEPAGGWTGAIGPVATLRAPSGDDLDSVADLGLSIVVGTVSSVSPMRPSDAAVFNEPAAGWAGTLKPAARLAVPNAAQDGWT